MLLENHEVANGFGTRHRRQQFDLRALEQNAIRTLRSAEFESRLRRIPRRRTTLQESEHAAELRVRLTATQLLGRLQPYHFCVRIDQSADFFSFLMAKGGEPHPCPSPFQLAFSRRWYRPFQSTTESRPVPAWKNNFGRSRR
jgi:hypothetical protein